MTDDRRGDDDAAGLGRRAAGGRSGEFEPGGLHVMLVDLAGPLESGSSFELTLTFATARVQDRDGRRPRRGPVTGRRRSRWMVDVHVAGRSSSAPAVDPDDAEERLPDIEVQTLRGGEAFRLDELHGPAVVNLWATWCVPCKRELPEFEAVHRVAGRRGDVRRCEHRRRR